MKLKSHFNDLPHGHRIPIRPLGGHKFPIPDSTYCLGRQAVWHCFHDPNISYAAIFPDNHHQLDGSLKIVVQCLRGE